MTQESKTSNAQPQCRPAGTVVPWPDQRRDLPEMTGNEQLVERNWTEIDAWTYAFLWHCVVSF
ncbi:MAG: hypothetical protein IT425_08085 [Pirellulales bacterium]|nr:hypothetical protein [Pirellulales bacterium]